MDRPRWFVRWAPALAAGAAAIWTTLAWTATGSASGSVVLGITMWVSFFVTLRVAATMNWIGKALLVLVAACTALALALVTFGLHGAVAV